MSAGADVVLARPSIASPADLKGKRIGVESTTLGTVMLYELLDSAGLQPADMSNTMTTVSGKRIGVESTTLGTVMLYELLDSAGLQPADVTVVPMSGDHVAAWKAGNLDALVTYEPWAEPLLASGLVDIFDTRRMPGVIVDVLAVREDRARAHEDELRALVSAHFEALRLWRSNPVDTAYRLSRFLDVEANEVGRVLNGLDLPDAVYDRHFLAPPATELSRTAADLGRILTKAGQLRHPPRLENLFIADYLPEGAG
jgi:NitT/TauT family transport system substrate-binding protein